MSSAFIPLRGIMVDDSPYWRNRLPYWLNQFSINLISFRSYGELFQHPVELDSHNLIIGDFRIRGVRSNGYHFMNNVRESQKGTSKTYVLMSVLPEHEIVERIGAKGLPEWLTYICKDTSPNLIAEKILSAADSRAPTL